MKRLLTLFLVIGVLGIYGQTTEIEIQADTTQNTDTIKIKEQESEGASVIRENIDSMDVLEKSDNDSLIMIKKNPWLYDWRYGCLTDGLTYLIPMITLYSIAERVDGYYKPLDNWCAPCIYPIGLIFAEKMYKNLITTKKDTITQGHTGISLSAQIGPSLPSWVHSYEYVEGLLLPINKFDFATISNLLVKYEFGFQKKAPLSCQMNYYNIGGANFLSIGCGLRINDFNLSVEKIIIGYYKELSYYYSQILLNNNFYIYERNYGYIVNFKYDFWGIGIGWGKKYKIWKELYIEPKLSYIFMYTFDFESGCVTGFIGGLGIGYQF